MVALVLAPIVLGVALYKLPPAIAKVLALLGPVSKSLVEAYLGDLDRALLGSDPREHAEIMEAVREHLAELLPSGAELVDVQRVLAELGPVEAIASNASPGMVPAAAPQKRTDIVPIVALAAAVVAAATVVPMPFVGVPLSISALVLALVHLRTRRAGRRLSWAALIIAGATLLCAIALALTLLPVGGSDTPEPGPVQTAAQL